jgi:hypothetical protein
VRRLAAEERRSHTFEVKQKREKNFYKREVESIKRKCELVGIVVLVVSVVIFAHGSKKKSL